MPSGPYLRNAQTFGSLQHCPQLMHAPLRFFETGRTEANVLFAFAAQVFLSTSAIDTILPTQKLFTMQLRRTIITVICDETRLQFHD